MVILTFVLAPTVATAFAAASLDRFGGWTGLQGQRTGFFHTQQIDGRWWLIDPDGNVFLSIGVNAIRFEGDTIRHTSRRPYQEAVQAKYGSRDAWVRASLRFLRSLGFNTIGAWSGPYTFEQGMPYTIILNMAARSGASWLHGSFIDVWDPKFEQTANDIASKVCARAKDSQWLIGYFTDNELHWGPDWRKRTTLLEEYLMLPAEAPGHLKAVEFLHQRYEKIADLNAAWHLNLLDWQNLDQPLRFDGKGRTRQAGQDSTQFLELVARRYFQVCHDAIKRHDPNHLILGCRLAFPRGGPVASAARGLVDVFSLSHYVPRPMAAALRMLHEASGAPVLVSEWAFRSRDSGLPNTKGAGPLVDTQQTRAQKYREYLTELLRLPFVVGAHWFKYTDEPAEGRFDGENSNYGLVNIKDEPYRAFVDVVRNTNAQVYTIHLSQ